MVSPSDPIRFLFVLSSSQLGIIARRPQSNGNWFSFSKCVYGVGGVWVQLLGVQGACIILVLRECIWNAAAVSLVLPAFDDTGSLSSPYQVVYPPV